MTFEVEDMPLELFILSELRDRFAAFEALEGWKPAVALMGFRHYKAFRDALCITEHADVVIPKFKGVQVMPAKIKGVRLVSSDMWKEMKDGHSRHA